MLKQNVRWSTSETKKIYQATKNSEILMEYLEEQLINANMATLISEDPSPSRGYGVLVYYYSLKPKKRLLSAAPRRKNNYIHVVIFNHILSNDYLKEIGFKMGRESQTIDILISNKEDIDKLVHALKKKLHKA